MHQIMALGAKAVSLNMYYDFSRFDGQTEQSDLCHLLYACAFAHCPNWLVTLTLVCPELF